MTRCSEPASSYSILYKNSMITKRSLQKLGFVLHEDHVSGCLLQLDFSEFERFECLIQFSKDVFGKPVVVLSDIKLYNQASDNETYLRMSYDVYFRNMSELKRFFVSIGYDLHKLNNVK